MKTLKVKKIRPIKKGSNVTIIGRRWFDKINGNTYFSAKGYVNNELVIDIPFEYGYDDMYRQRTFEELIKLGYCSDVEKYNNGSHESYWQYFDRKGIKSLISVSDVSRKKDL